MTKIEGERRVFQQELDRIEQNLTNEFNALAVLRDDYNMIQLQPVIEHVGNALIDFKTFDENYTQEGCFICSRPIDKDNHQVVDGKKVCSDSCRRRVKGNRFEYGDWGLIMSLKQAAKIKRLEYEIEALEKTIEHMNHIKEIEECMKAKNR